jgi:hypothetical protein
VDAAAGAARKTMIVAVAAGVVSARKTKTTMTVKTIAVVAVFVRVWVKKAMIAVRPHAVAESAFRGAKMTRVKRTSRPKKARCPRPGREDQRPQRPHRQARPLNRYRRHVAPGPSRPKISPPPWVVHPQLPGADRPLPSNRRKLKHPNKPRCPRRAGQL